MVYFLSLSSLIVKTNIAKAIIRLNTSKVDNLGSPFSRFDTYIHKHHLLEMDCHHLFTFLQNVLYRNFLSQTRLNCTKLPSQSGTYITMLGCYTRLFIRQKPWDNSMAACHVLLSNLNVTGKDLHLT